MSAAPRFNAAPGRLRLRRVAFARLERIREEHVLRPEEPPREEKASPRTVQRMTTPERWEGSIAQAAEWLDRAAFPGAASTLLHAALEAEWSWKAWGETGTPKVTWPQDRPPTLRELPALVYSTPPDFKGFVASCPREVLPFLASRFYIAVEEARAVRPYSLGAFFEESRRPLRESLAAVVPKGKKGKPHTPHAARIFLQVHYGRPLAEVAEMFGISVQTVRVTVSEERKRRGLPPLRKTEK